MGSKKKKNKNKAPLPQFTTTIINPSIAENIREGVEKVARDLARGLEGIRKQTLLAFPEDATLEEIAEKLSSILGYDVVVVAAEDFGTYDAKADPVDSCGDCKDGGLCLCDGEPEPDPLEEFRSAVHRRFAELHREIAELKPKPNPAPEPQPEPNAAQYLDMKVRLQHFLDAQFQWPASGEEILAYYLRAVMHQKYDPVLVANDYLKRELPGFRKMVEDNNDELGDVILGTYGVDFVVPDGEGGVTRVSRRWSRAISPMAPADKFRTMWEAF